MVTSIRHQLQLFVTQIHSPQGQHYQCLEIDICGELQPSTLSHLELPKNLDFNQGIVLWGSAPTWLYSHLIKRCQSAPWLGCYNILLGGFVVVASRHSAMVPGDCYKLMNHDQCAAILIGGSPNSGKSVLCHALDYTLNHSVPDKQIHLHRAQWDGEGNWYAQMRNRPLADELNKRCRANKSDRFFLFHSDAVSNIRQDMELVLVDFGGMPKRKDIILLHRCTHYIIISSQPEDIPEWHNFCKKRGGLEPLAVIHSVLDERLDVLQEKPYLEIIAGPWERGKTFTVPDILLEKVLALSKT
jgi:CRISPR-associated protein Csx3